MKRGTRKPRGAALLEGVIVLPCFAILLAGIAFVTKAEQQRLDVSAAAREATLQDAVSGCGKPGDPARPGAAIPPHPGIESLLSSNMDRERNLPYLAAPPGVSPDALFRAASEAHGAGGDLTTREFYFSSARATFTRKVKLPWREITLVDTAQKTLLCNEPAYPGRQRDVYTKFLEQVL